MIKDNGTDGTERASTGGGPPGVRVRRQLGQEDTQHRLELSGNREALGMEPDENQWEGLVRPLQLHCISQASREDINLPHVDIQGEPGGELGMQQQHRTLQETRGESWWEEIVRRPRQEKGDPVTSLTWHCTHQEQC
jgi:hypothetical protein